MFQLELRSKQGLLVNSAISQTDLLEHTLWSLAVFLWTCGRYAGNTMPLDSWTSGLGLPQVHTHPWLAVQTQHGYLTSPGLSFFFYKWEKHHLPWRRFKLVFPPGWSSYFTVTVNVSALARNKPSWILHVPACSEAHCPEMGTNLLQQEENRKGTLTATSLGSRRWHTCRLTLLKDPNFQ